MSEKSFLTAFVETGFAKIELLEVSENKRTRNPEVYVVTLTAQKARPSLRAPLQRSHPSVLSLEHAAETLKELWIFPVAPETCNLSCSHCLYAASPKTRNPYRLSTVEFAGLLEQVESLSAKPHFLFTGGEPTLHPELYDFLEMTDAKGRSFQVMTNGTRIQAEDADRLAKMAHLSKVQVSLESPEPEINDSIYGPGIHRRALKAVDTLRGKGVEVTLAVTPMDANQQGLGGIEEIARAKEADVIYISLYDLGAAKENGLKAADAMPNGKSQTDFQLMCDKGVAYSEGAFYPCPVLVKEPGTKLGLNLSEALSADSREKVRNLRQRHPACQVCLKGST